MRRYLESRNGIGNPDLLKAVGKIPTKLATRCGAIEMPLPNVWILSLTWDRVDFVNRRVDFQEPGRQLTAKRRAIAPINAPLLALLSEARQAAQSAYVVEYEGRPVPYGLRWSFARLCQRAGLDWRPTPHHLKHSVASWLAMEGVPIDQAADLLGTDPRTLRRTYRKFDPTYLAPVVNALVL